MSDIRSKVNMLYSLEQLSAGQTALHRIHPLAKMIVTGVYLICAASLGRYELGQLTPFLFYPVILMAIGEIPYGMMIRRASVALPFCLFAGISNLIFDRTILFLIFNLPVTGGLISLAVLLLRTILCVGAVLILVAATPFSRLTGQLRRLHVPNLFVMLLEMTYRYISVLIQESADMLTAYRLRSNGAKWPDIRHFGVFVGQLLLRSTDRAERVYQAMQCRLYSLRDERKDSSAWDRNDWIFMILGCGSSLLFRLVNVPAFLGGVLTW